MPAWAARRSVVIAVPAVPGRTFDFTPGGECGATGLTRDHGAMAQSRPTTTTITDPRTMRAMAHPARIEIMEHLSSTGDAVTATDMARLVGLSPSATSYHLRELAKYGLVEQAPSRGDARERVWRSTSASWSVDAGSTSSPDVRAAEQALLDVYLTRDYARVRDWLARVHTEPAEWRDASSVADQMLLLTSSELRALNEAVRDLLAKYSRRERLADAPEGARTVVANFALFPVD
jgi:DNA-binding transcriptional ArsR family regulator